MKKVTSLNLKIFLIVCISILSINYTVAQVGTVIQLTDGDFESAQLKHITTKSSLQEKDNSQRFFEIANELLPTIYVKNGSIRKVKGESNPVELKSDDFQLNSFLSSNNKLFESIELITIKLKQQSDLRKSINTATLKEFKNLKFILIKCYFECSDTQIRSIVLNTNPKITVYYIITNPS